MSEQIAELAKALAAAQGEIKPAELDRVNPHFKSKYATLASIQAACRAPLAKHGLAVAQGVAIDGKNVKLDTLLMHSSGQWIASEMELFLNQLDMQKLGSALTYARRYSLAAIVGIVADEDDDGNAASGPADNAGGFKRDPSTFKAGAPQGQTTTAGKPAVKKPLNHAPVPDPANAMEAANYVIMSGKFAGQQIKDIDQKELSDYCEWIMNDAHKKNKPLTGQSKQLVGAANLYLSQF